MSVHRTTLALIVARSGRSHEDHVRELSSLGRRAGEGATFSIRQFDRWLAGTIKTLPRSATVKILERYYQRSVEDLFGPPGRTSEQPAALPQALQPVQQGLEVMAVMAAHESSEHAALAAVQIDESSIQDLQQRLLEAARRYAATPPIYMFVELVRLRDQANRLLERTRIPRQTSDLYVVAGQCCALLAGVDLDLGYRDAAAEQARAAHTYGKIADHASLSAFALALQSTVAFWSGQPRRAVHLAAEGLELRSSGTAGVRLRAVAARGWALLGEAEQTYAALAAADEARADAGDDEMLDGIGGEFGFPPARLALCSAAAYLALEDGEKAAAAARNALESFAVSPPHERWIGGEYGARLDLVAATVIEGDWSQAADAMEPVMALPGEQHTERLTQRVRALRATASRPGLRSVRSARHLSEMAEDFIADSGPQPLPPAEAGPDALCR
jgi:hypothetical protein